jgi:hypothetical protein
MGGGTHGCVPPSHWLFENFFNALHTGRYMHFEWLLRKDWATPRGFCPSSQQRCQRGRSKKNGYVGVRHNINKISQLRWRVYVWKIFTYLTYVEMNMWRPYVHTGVIPPPTVQGATGLINIWQRWTHPTTSLTLESTLSRLGQSSVPAASIRGARTSVPVSLQDANQSLVYQSTSSVLRQYPNN